MRTESILLFALLLGGCQSTPPAAPAPAPLPAKPAAQIPVFDPSIRQRRHIEALIAQNEALGARVRELESQPKSLPVSPPPRLVPQVMVPVSSPKPAETEPALMPGLDGILDLAAPRAGDESNPFAVRAVAADAAREITLRIDGIVHGPVSCAVVNGRTIQAGDRVETLEVLRVERAALLLRHGGELLRLPLSEKPIRIRLPL